MANAAHFASHAANRQARTISIRIAEGLMRISAAMAARSAPPLSERLRHDIGETGLRPSGEELRRHPVQSYPPSLEAALNRRI